MSTDPLWINADAGAPEYSAVELRRNLAALVTHGVADGLGARAGVRPGGTPAFTLSGTTVSVLPRPVVVYPGQSSTDGPYLGHLVTDTHALAAADGSNPRIDIVVVRVYDDHDASGRRELVTEYITGTPAASPTAPAAPSGAFVALEILVPAGGSPSPSATYVAPHTVASGGVVPLRDGESFPSSGVHEGMYADRDGALWRRTGSGWVAAASPSSPTLVTFTSSGSFVKANYPWARRVRVRVQAGGGAGGGAPATSSGQTSAGVGASGGVYAESWIDVGDLGASETVTVGSGGSGSSGADGGNGQSSSFGSHVTAAPGIGGSTVGAAAALGAAIGNIATTSGTGQIVIGGGGSGCAFRLGGGTNNGVSGHGGSSHLGNGGRSRTGAGAGNAGQGFGAGGGGASNNPSSSAQSGGAGAPGIVIVEVY